MIPKVVGEVAIAKGNTVVDEKTTLGVILALGAAAPAEGKPEEDGALAGTKYIVRPCSSVIFMERPNESGIRRTSPVLEVL